MSIKLDVPLLAQEKANCCWHTAAMMIWRYHQQQTRRQGPMHTVPEAYSRADTEPLYWAEFITLAKNVGMLSYPMANNYTADNLKKMMTEYGPLWCCGMWYGVCHVIVLTGVEGGTVYLNDPDRGVKKTGTINWFNQKLYSGANCSIMVKDPARY
jgi:ABC-type bacteriocin/lantibiotic exporter with double-glycine peptidase domain